MVKRAELNVIFDVVIRLRHPKYLGTQADCGSGKTPLEQACYVHTIYVSGMIGIMWPLTLK